MKITVIGAGYVGLSNAILLSYHHPVTLLDIDEDKVAKINQGISPIVDKEIEKALKSDEIHLFTTTCKKEALSHADFVILACPTNYDVALNYFDTKILEQMIDETLHMNAHCTIVIKSTIPIGFTHRMQALYPNRDIFFSPEFLREGRALWDNLYPSRIIIGAKSQQAKAFATLLQQAVKEPCPVLFTQPLEAESIKLFSNTYLALRVAFFNELDTYAMSHHLNTADIIKGVSLDERIGDFYNNPSFGYGGLCLPKDTKQLQANFANLPQSLISAVIQSNELRKDFLVENILQKQVKTVGIYRLSMKKGSDNYRSSAILDIMQKLNQRRVQILIFEPLLEDNHDFPYATLCTDFDSFKEQTDIIIANRFEEELENVKNKVYTRDIFLRD